MLKLHRIIAQSYSWNENFVSTSKNVLKNRNWTFPIVHYFTRKTRVRLEYIVTDCRYIQKLETLSRHIQNLVQFFHMLKPDILRILKYSECFPITFQHTFRTLSYLQKFTNIQNLDILKTWHIFRTLSKI